MVLVAQEIVMANLILNTKAVLYIWITIISIFAYKFISLFMPILKLKFAVWASSLLTQVALEDIFLLQLK